MPLITQIDCQTIQVPLKRPFVTAVRTTETITDLQVTITLENGVQGIGTAPGTTMITGDTLAGMQSVIQTHFKPHLLGSSLAQQISQIEQIDRWVPFNSGAKMAIDLALHDAAAQQAGDTLPHFLGGQSNTVTTDMTIVCGSLESIENQVNNALNQGFEILKVKLGTMIDHDLNVLQWLNNYLPSHVTIRIDANQGWTFDQALRFIQKAEAMDMTLSVIEQPVCRHDIDSMVALTAQSSFPIMADEAIFSVHDAKRYCQAKACDQINIKLAKAGGIGQARAIKAMADRYNIPCFVGCMMESPRGIRAAASFALANQIDQIDLDPVDWVGTEYLKPHLAFDCPTIQVIS